MMTRYDKAGSLVDLELDKVWACSQCYSGRFSWTPFERPMLTSRMLQGHLKHS